MEVTDDLRILFDFMLPVILLYGPERQQFKRLRENATVNNQNCEWLAFFDIFTFTWRENGIKITVDDLICHSYDS